MGFVCPDCLAEIAEATVETCIGCGTVRPPSGWLPDPLTGLIIGGRYRLESRLGAGGMAAVFRASRVGALGGTVAVKLLAPRLARTVIAKRFEREAQVVSRLTNPYIVRIYDFDTFKLPGREDSLYYFAMELVEGPTLTTVLRKQGKVNFLWGIDILRQIARGLDEAHSQGITHRDLKPSNIMLQSQRGATHVKILDFGIAALSERDGGSSLGPNQEKLTQTGFISGTPDYMAPEQAVGDAGIGAPADIYALGLVAYEMFSGQRAFSGGNTMEILLARVTKPPPKLAEVSPPETPPDLFRIVDKMLAKDWKERYQSAGELLDDLAIFPTLQTSPDFVPPAELLQKYPSTRSSLPAAQPVAESKEQAASTRIAPSSIRPAPTKKKGAGAWLWILVVLVLGGIGAAIAVVMTKDKPPVEPTKETTVANAGADATTGTDAVASAETQAPATTVAASAPPETRTEPDVAVAAPEVTQPVPVELSGPRPAIEGGFTEVELAVGDFRLKIATPTSAPPLYAPMAMRASLDRGTTALRITRGTATLTLARDGQAVGRAEGTGRDDGRLALDLPSRPLADRYLVVLSLFLPDGTEVPVRVALDGATGKLSAP